MSAPHVELLASFDSLSLTLQREGYTPSPIIDMASLRAVAESSCDRCESQGMEAQAFYRTSFGVFRVGPCRIVARCAKCGHSEER